MRAGAALRVTHGRRSCAGSAAAEAGAQFPFTIYASFGEHYISVSSESSSLLSHVARNLEPMLALEPVGSAAGTFYISEAQGALSTGEEGSTAQHHWDDLHSAVRTLHHAVIKRFIDVRSDLLWIHAGVVAFAGRALVLAAPAGQGKSTMVGELLEWGCTYLSDEVAPIDPVKRAVLPFPVSPWKRVTTNENYPPERLHEIPKVPVRLASTVVAAAPVSLGQIYLLRHVQHSTATPIVPCSPAVAVLEMSRNSFNSQESRAVEFGRLCEVASRVQAAYLDYADATEAAQRIIAVAPLA